MDNLMDKVFAYNRKILEQESKAKTIDEIRSHFDALPKVITLRDAMDFLLWLREQLTGRRD